jgi:hypothetical protein
VFSSLSPLRAPVILQLTTTFWGWLVHSWVEMLTLTNGMRLLVLHESGFSLPLAFWKCLSSFTALCQGVWEAVSGVSPLVQTDQGLLWTCTDFQHSAAYVSFHLPVYKIVSSF